MDFYGSRMCPLLTANSLSGRGFPRKGHLLRVMKSSLLKVKLFGLLILRAHSKAPLKLSAGLQLQQRCTNSASFVSSREAQPRTSLCQNIRRDRGCTEQDLHFIDS